MPHRVAGDTDTNKDQDQNQNQKQNQTQSEKQKQKQTQRLTRYDGDGASDNDVDEDEDTRHAVTKPRDRFEVAATHLAAHVSDRALDALRHPAVIDRVMTVLDPVVNRVISRLFPYLVLLSTLFAVLLGVTAFTLVYLVRGGARGNSSSSGSSGSSGSNSCCSSCNNGSIGTRL